MIETLKVSLTTASPLKAKLTVSTLGGSVYLISRPETLTKTATLNMFVLLSDRRDMILGYALERVATETLGFRPDIIWRTWVEILELDDPKGAIHVPYAVDDPCEAVDGCACDCKAALILAKQLADTTKRALAQLDDRLRAIENPAPNRQGIGAPDQQGADLPFALSETRPSAVYPLRSVYPQGGQPT